MITTVKSYFRIWIHRLRKKVLLLWNKCVTLVMQRLNPIILFFSKPSKLEQFSSRHLQIRILLPMVTFSHKINYVLESVLKSELDRNGGRLRIGTRQHYNLLWKATVNHHRGHMFLWVRKSVVSARPR